MLFSGTGRGAGMSPGLSGRSLAPDADYPSTVVSCLVPPPPPPLVLEGQLTVESQLT